MSQWKREEQLRLYRKAMGEEAAARQEKEAKRARGACICEVRKVKKKWNGEFAPVSERLIHQQGCPKWKWWMDEV